MPPGDDGEVRLAALLRRGLAHLRAGQTREAVEALGVVVDDADLAQAHDLRDVRARACSLYGEALLAHGRTEDAVRALDQAIASLRALGDVDGVDQVESLRASARVAPARDATGPPHAREPRAERPDRSSGVAPEALVAGVTEPVDRAEALLRKASADLGAAHPAAAESARLAVEAARASGSARHEVLARIALAHASPDEAVANLSAAWERAVRDAEPALVAAVARAADLAGVARPGASGDQV